LISNLEFSLVVTMTLPFSSQAVEMFLHSKNMLLLRSENGKCDKHFLKAGYFC
jgi:hypothetical protein